MFSKHRFVEPAAARGARVRFQRGFTLVELMIGLVIGLVTTLVVTQVLVVSEGQKRTSVDATDAQVNGALALNAIQRTVQAAGYGFAANPTSLGCALTAKFGGVNVPGFPATLAPVTITVDTTGRPDTVRVLASSKNSYSLPTRILAPGYTSSNAFLNTAFPVASVRGIEGPKKDSTGAVIGPGDLMIAVVDSTVPCQMFQVTDDPTTASSVSRADDSAKWNPAGQPSGSFSNGNYLINMGTMLDRTFSIAGNSLMLNSFALAADSTPSYTGATEIYSNIVNLKALYGKDTDANGTVDTWDTATPTTSTGWQQVLALRIALVARSTQYEKEVVTSANLQWDVGSAVTIPGTSACGTGQCLNVKIDHLGSGGTGTEWQHYRYKLFDTVIPLRNILWNS